MDSVFTEAELKQFEIDTLKVFHKFSDKNIGKGILVFPFSDQSVYDAYIEYLDGRKLYLEYKFRRSNHKEWLLEKDKYDNIMKFGNGVYICQYFGNIYYYNLLQIPKSELIVQKIPMNKTTNYKNRTIIFKDVYFLPEKYKKQL